MNTTHPVSATISAADKTSIINKTAQIAALLPFLVAKTNEERKIGFKLGDSTIAFAQKANVYAAQFPQFVPNFVDVAEWNKDAKLATDLHDLLAVIEPVVQNIHDTFQEAGLEAMDSAHAFYNSVKQAAHNNIPGAQAIFDDLKVQFQKGRKKVIAPITNVQHQ